MSSDRHPAINLFSRLRSWIAGCLAIDSSPRGSRRTASTVIICLVICIVALTVRYLHWQDKHTEIVWSRTSLMGLFNRYNNEAVRINNGGGVLFPAERPLDGDAKLLVYPPGYSLLVAAANRITADPYSLLWILQAGCDALAAIVVFLIAGEMFRRAIGLIAALFVALSPHFAYYSLVLSPDTLPVLPVLIAVWLLIKGIKSPRWLLFISAGLLIGLSCWLRANALWLTPVLAVAAFVLVPRKRLRYSALLIAGTLLAIAPITVRNLIVFRSFIPLTLQSGLSLVEGIGDYDREGRFGMPTSDRQSRQKDAEWFGRPDYAESLWKPDGIERDRYRTARAIAVIRGNRGWFLSVMIRRAAYMLSYNDSRVAAWPENTKNVSPILAEPAFGHEFDAPASRGDSTGPPETAVLNGSVLNSSPRIPDGTEPVWSTSAGDIAIAGTLLSPQAALSFDQQALKLDTDSSDYSDQLLIDAVPVQRNSDYVLRVLTRIESNDVAVKVTDSRRRISLASASIAAATGSTPAPRTDPDAPPPRSESGGLVLVLPFSSGDRDEIQVVLSNNNSVPARSTVLIGSVDLRLLGPTGGRWTRPLRWLARAIQRGLFTTGRMLTFIIAGAVLLLLGRRGRDLLILLALPFYYIGSHSIIHTEYRYILGAHYVLFVLASVSIYVFWKLLVSGVIRARRLAERNSE